MRAIRARSGCGNDQNRVACEASAPRCEVWNKGSSSSPKNNKVFFLRLLQVVAHLKTSRDPQRIVHTQRRCMRLPMQASPTD